MTEDEDNDGNISENEIVNDNPACPNCLHNFKVIKSKYPGKQWYCLECKKGFDEEKEGIEQKKTILKMAEQKMELIKKDGKFNYFKDLNNNNIDYSQEQYLLDFQYLENLGKEEIEISDADIDFHDEHLTGEEVFDKFKTRDK